MTTKSKSAVTRTAPTHIINNVTLGATTSYTSGSILTDFHRNFILYLHISSTGSPTDVVFSVEFSHDNVTWYKFQNWFYGDLRYEDTATEDPGIYESMNFPCAGKYMRIVATGTGTDGSNSFIVDAYIEFYT